VAPVFRLQQVEDFRSFCCKPLADAFFAHSDQRDI
jgi:hypothetical protein